MDTFIQKLVSKNMIKSFKNNFGESWSSVFSMCCGGQIYDFHDLVFDPHNAKNKIVVHFKKPNYITTAKYYLDNNNRNINNCKSFCLRDKSCFIKVGTGTFEMRILESENLNQYFLDLSTNTIKK